MCHTVRHFSCEPAVLVMQGPVGEEKGAEKPSHVLRGAIVNYLPFALGSKQSWARQGGYVHRDDVWPRRAWLEACRWRRTRPPLPSERSRALSPACVAVGARSWSS